MLKFPRQIKFPAFQRKKINAQISSFKSTAFQKRKKKEINQNLQVSIKNKTQFLYQEIL